MSKTKVLVFKRNEERTECRMSVDGQILEQVNGVVYLGSRFSKDGRHQMDSKRRIPAGNRAQCLSCIDETVKRQHSCTFGRL